MNDEIFKNWWFCNKSCTIKVLLHYNAITIYTLEYNTLGCDLQDNFAGSFTLISLVIPVNSLFSCHLLFSLVSLVSASTSVYSPQSTLLTINASPAAIVLRSIGKSYFINNFSQNIFYGCC